jgi:hypothetical protein
MFMELGVFRCVKTELRSGGYVRLAKIKAETVTLLALGLILISYYSNEEKRHGSPPGYFTQLILSIMVIANHGQELSLKNELYAPHAPTSDKNLSKN